MSDGSLAPLVRLLPPVSRVSGERVDSAATIQALLGRCWGGQAGAHAALERIAEFLLIETIAAQLRRQGLSIGEDVDDPAIATALALIHANPQVAWTVGSLARRVAMSRTAFAARFTECVGEPPIQYLTRHRIERAEQLLATTHLSLSEVAARVGYGDAASLCRAFKRVRGQTPGTTRAGALKSTSSAD